MQEVHETVCKQSEESPQSTISPILQQSVEDDLETSSCCYHQKNASTAGQKRAAAPPPPFLDGNSEAMAFALDSLATSIMFSSSGAFLVTALIKLAKGAAGCDVEGKLADDECTRTIHGFKPSSLVSSYYTIIGMTAAVSMPVIGAIVDTTQYRRGLGRILAVLFLAFHFATIFVSRDNWFEMSICFAIMGFVGFFETMALYSYLPELTDNPDTLNRITRTFSVISYSGMVLFLGTIVGVSMALHPPDKETLNDDIATARLSQAAAFCVAFICLFISWGFLFQKRPAARILQENETVVRSSFVQLYRTALKVHQGFPALQWFFLAIALSDAATSALMIISITFFTDVMDFNGAQTGAAIVIFLLASIPGSLFSSWCTRWYNPVWSSIVAVAILICNTALVAAILRSPDQEMGAYLLAIGWGIGTGWKWTVDRVLYATILPPGQNAEFSGAYLFSRQCLTWLPPLVFTIMNESDINLRWGMASVNLFLIASLVVYISGVRVGYATFVKGKNTTAAQDLDHPVVND